MIKTVRIKNHFGEELDTLIEGNEQSNITIIFVHGFGSDKNENGNLFKVISSSLLDKYRIIRFDFSGNGSSEGSEEDDNYNKQSTDLESVIGWVQKNHQGSTNLLAISAGCYVTSILNPENIERSVFLSIPHDNTKITKKFIQDRIIQKGGELNENGISIFPRTSGRIQRIGPSFWQALDEIYYPDLLKEFTKKTNLLMIHPADDEIVIDKYVQQQKVNINAKYLEIPGNHSFSNPKDRKKLITTISQFLDS